MASNFVVWSLPVPFFAPSWSSHDSDGPARWANRGSDYRSNLSGRGITACSALVSLEQIPVVILDQIRALLSNHIDKVLDAAIRDDWHDGNIDDAKVVDAVDLQSPGGPGQPSP